MQGVTFLTDGQNRKIAVQIELKVLEKYNQDLEDLLDGIIAEARKHDERVPLDQVIKDLEDKGKLK